MEAELSRGRAAALGAYERGRAILAAKHAAVATALVGTIAAVVLVPHALFWLPVTALVVVFAEWRGGALMHGARRGIAAGLVTLLLPMTVLRPCCRPGEMMGDGACCATPSSCIAAGAIVGLAIAALVPMPRGSRIRAAAGMVLGMLSVACLKCEALFLGEAAGLLGGLAAGVVAAGLARGLVERRVGAR